MDKPEIKILLMEDDEDDVILIKDFIHSGMKRVMVSIDHVTSFSEAVSCLKKVNYEICLFDCRLVAGDGLDLLRSIRAEGITTPVIFLTSQRDEETAPEAIKAGATNYLAKAGLSSELLCQSIRYVLELQKREALCKQLEDALRDSEERYRLLFEITPCPVWVYDLETLSFLAVNDAAVYCYGYSHDEFLAMTVKDICALEDVPSLLDYISKIGTDVDWAGTVKHRKKDGTIIHVEITSRPLIFTGRPARLVLANDITERKQAEETIHHLAYYDPVTSLPNRTLFNDRLTVALTHAQRSRQKLAVMVLDLDRFKTINDTLGHIQGDHLLQGVAKRLRSCLREGDTVARLGGDEFMLLLPEIDHEEDTIKVAQKILETLKPSFHFQDHELHITASIGIALYPGDGEDVETLIKNADTAMYQAKDQGRDKYQFYASAMNATAFEQLILENSLRSALEREEFTVHYQPQISINTGQIVGMEALVRWKHPELGLVPPMKFIPLAEETGIIVPLGEKVLHTACTQSKAWQDAGFPPLRVAVNISGRLFKQQTLGEIIAGILRETRLDPTYLELELTESIIMENVEMTIKTLGKLKEMGVSLAIDDFGTGYSSLGYLKRFPIDTLKIDRSFVRDITTDLDDVAIARLIITMAHSLNLKVIAEGVETEEQLAFLRFYQCDEMQGYLFSKPVPAEVFIQFLREGRRLNLGKGS